MYLYNATFLIDAVIYFANATRGSFCTCSLNKIIHFTFVVDFSYLCVHYMFAI